MIALKAAEVGEVPDLSPHPEFSDFVAWRLSRAAGVQLRLDPSSRPSESSLEPARHRSDRPVITGSVYK